MEVVGEYLGLDQDSALFAYFQRHWSHFLPRLRGLHRTTFVRQAANLRGLKDQLRQWLRERLPHDPTLAILDSVAIPAVSSRVLRVADALRGKQAMDRII
jgi:hypothetical protein